MSEKDSSVTYSCDLCGHQNTWSRDEILQRGKKVVFRGDGWEEYSLACQRNIRPPCPGHHVVEVKVK